MKKKILSLAVATGLVGAASVAQAQMHINEKGLGEALVYPFYSAANGNDTYVHVVNTSSDTKAVKVRFIEAMNSQEVLDFNLYLSPDDVWAGVITSNPNGDGAIIRTVDNSCTVPMIGTGPGGNVTELGDGSTQRDQPFVNIRYQGDEDASIARTNEGYIEIIEMGQLNPNTGLGAEAVHNEEGFPGAGGDGEGCAELVNAWSTGGAWYGGAPETGFRADWDAEGTAGGLYGYGVVINVPQGRAAGYDAVAIDDFRAAGQENIHFEPGDELPNLEQSQPEVTIFDGVAPNTMLFTADPADPVSALFMSTHIMNDYVTDPGINATTDWVVTMPTKRFYVDVPTQYADTPFNSPWDEERNQACEYVAFDFFDREEANVISSEGPQFSPRPVDSISNDLTLCREVSLISWAGSESALNGSSRILHGIDSGYDEGWASLSFEVTDLVQDSQNNLQGGARELVADDGTTLHGLPVAGFAVFSYQNGQLDGGVLSNYSAASEHKNAIRVD